MATTQITWAVALAFLVLPGLASARAPQSNTGAGASTSLALTPRQPEGPNYPTQKLADRDNDLTRLGNAVPAQGAGAGALWQPRG